MISMPSSTTNQTPIFRFYLQTTTKTKARIPIFKCITENKIKPRRPVNKIIIFLVILRSISYKTILYWPWCILIMHWISFVCSRGVPVEVLWGVRPSIGLVWVRGSLREKELRLGAWLPMWIKLWLAGHQYSCTHINNEYQNF